jgi:hypothetical protein
LCIGKSAPGMRQRVIIEHQSATALHPLLL